MTSASRSKGEDLMTSDSSVFNHTFYGILNRQGQFWSPLGFASRKDAETALTKFVVSDPEKFGSMLQTHRIVPVRIQLTHLTDQEGQNR